jgi:hypothetical protein
MRHVRVGHGAFPPAEQMDVMSMATSTPAEYHCPATRGSLDDMVAAFHQQRRPRTMSRSSLWRLLEEADLKPPRSVYWLNSHAPDFEAKARDIGFLYVNALRFYEQGRWIICADEKTGMQILQRLYPPHSRPNRASRRNANTSTSAMACGR